MQNHSVPCGYIGTPLHHVGSIEDGVSHVGTPNRLLAGNFALPLTPLVQRCASSSPAESASNAELGEASLIT